MSATAELSQEREQIVITGVGPVSILGVGASAFEKAFLQAASVAATEQAFRAIEGFDVHAYATLKTQCLDPASAMAVAAASLALSDAGWGACPCDATRIGMVLGTAHGNGSVLRDYLEKNKTSPLRFIHTFMNTPAGLASQVLRLRGAHALLCSGDVAGLQAVRYACHLLRTKKADRILCGGVDSLRFRKDAKVSPAQQDSPEGYGEGAGILALERKSDAASRRVYAEVSGMGSASDRRLEPAVFGRALRKALYGAGICADEVGAVVLATGRESPSGQLERAGLREAGFGDERWVDLASHTGKIGAALGALGVIVASLLLAGRREIRNVVVMGFDRNQCNALILRRAEHVRA